MFTMWPLDSSVRNVRPRWTGLSFVINNIASRKWKKWNYPLWYKISTITKVARSNIFKYFFPSVRQRGTLSPEMNLKLGFLHWVNTERKYSKNLLAALITFSMKTLTYSKCNNKYNNRVTVTDRWISEIASIVQFACIGSICENAWPKFFDRYPCSRRFACRCVRKRIATHRTGKEKQEEGVRFMNTRENYRLGSTC